MGPKPCYVKDDTTSIWYWIPDRLAFHLRSGLDRGFLVILWDFSFIASPPSIKSQKLSSSCLKIRFWEAYFIHILNKIRIKYRAKRPLHYTCEWLVLGSKPEDSLRYAFFLLTVGGETMSGFALLLTLCLDPWGTRLAICNCSKKTIERIFNLSFGLNHPLTHFWTAWCLLGKLVKSI